MIFGKSLINVFTYTEKASYTFLVFGIMMMYRLCQSPLVLGEGATVCVCGGGHSQNLSLVGGGGGGDGVIHIPHALKG